MSEYLTRHISQGDYDHPTNLQTMQHCLPVDYEEEGIRNSGMRFEEAFDELQTIQAGIIKAPEVYNFSEKPLIWSSVHWPQNNVSILYGAEDNAEILEAALGTIVLWRGDLHFAGLNAHNAVMAARYVQQFNDPYYQLQRAELGVTATDLQMGKDEIEKYHKNKFGYYDRSESQIERAVLEHAPSMFDHQTERPFESAGLVTQGMVDAATEAEGEGLSLLTFYHGNRHNNLNRHLRPLLRKTGMNINTSQEGITLIQRGKAHEIPTQLDY